MNHSRTTDEIREKLNRIVSFENEDNWWKPELFEKNTRRLLPSKLEILKAPPAKEKQFNCFIYALGLQNNESFWDERSWVFRSDFFKLLVKNGYLKTTASPAKSDIILYENQTGEITHAGVLESPEMEISKWSWGPLIRHPIWFVPKSYGDKISFYKKPDFETLTKIIYLATHADA